MKLVGYIRLSKSGKTMKINLSEEALQSCERYLTKNGDEFIALVVNADKVGPILSGNKEITGISQ